MKHIYGLILYYWNQCKAEHLKKLYNCLVSGKKTNTIIRAEDLILAEDTILKRNNWKLGKIDLFKGHHKRFGATKMKIFNKHSIHQFITRPIKMLRTKSISKFFEHLDIDSDLTSASKLDQTPNYLAKEISTLI